MKKYEYAGKEPNQKYHELTEKYGTDKMIFFCLDYAFEDKKVPADVKEYFDNSEGYYDFQNVNTVAKEFISKMLTIIILIIPTVIQKQITLAIDEETEK